MVDIVDVLYRMRNMAGEQESILRAAIVEAQAVLDKLSEFADGAEQAAEGMAFIKPNYGGGTQFPVVSSTNTRKEQP